MCVHVCVLLDSVQNSCDLCWRIEREPVKGGVVLKGHLASVIQVLTE